MSTFTSEFKARKLDDKYYQLTDGFCFWFYWSKDYFGHDGILPWCIITIFPGAVTDFASVPKPLDKWFPKKGKKVAHAAIVHDLLYQFQLFDRKTADKIFLLGLRVLGLSRNKRKLMYCGVRCFGWKPYSSYKHQMKRKCAPLEYYSIADQPILIEWKHSFFDTLAAVSKYENEILPKANQAFVNQIQGVNHG